MILAAEPKTDTLYCPEVGGACRFKGGAAFAMEQFAMSERRACRLAELDRSSYRHEPRADHNAQLREELVKLARQKPRYG